ncbi:hypothetical protein P280DRAFT_472416 [Massarina eburnea CBS 473.64]|uniref:Uncharacterized protein n=1 Tax=Massarina eburnea CBS 473.64 TaxID=1395130 RepID=A0A6A6RPU4_9PLEO|nr:hypothetical protein P280DRAFT_472416 [Massarina eburnea CBS 473.64]
MVVKCMCARVGGDVGGRGFLGGGVLGAAGVKRSSSNRDRDDEQGQGAGRHVRPQGRGREAHTYVVQQHWGRLLAI